MQWNSALSRVFLCAFLGLALGWYFGWPLAGAVAALLALALFWSYQIWRLQTWLKSSDPPPADLYGLWGDIVSQIHKQRRVAEETETRLQSLVDYLLESFASMRDGVVIVDAQGAIKWCNDMAAEMLALQFPEDTGQAITNLVRYPDFKSYVNAGDYTDPLYLCTNGDGKRHLQIIITRFGRGDSLLFVRDVSERVRLDQARRDFVGNISHELRTPLTVITGYLGTLLSDTERLPGYMLKPLQQMDQQADRMENLLKDLLWLARIESEEREEKREPIDIKALLEEMKDELGATHPGRRILLRLSAERRVFGDYRELYSAISNLVQNAMKYSAADTTVTVGWRVGPDGYYLSVRDQGIGIEQSHIPRLTERFYRVDDSRSSSTGGTGLGLAIVKHVAASHGARLNIESEPGKGSTFTLVFPGESGVEQASRTEQRHVQC